MTDPPHPRLSHIPQVTIIGPGLLGGSVGLGLREAGYAGRITGFSRTQDTLDAARRVGAIDAGFTTLGDALPAEGDGLVVIAVPVGCFAEVFGGLADHQRAGLFITDAGSTKASVVVDARQHLRDPSRFVPAHPMAGSERQGPEHAESGLFRGRPCVLCPDDATDTDALAVVTALWEALGMTMHTMTAEQHDRQAAAVSHLPHLLAVLLTKTAAELGPLDLASSGFRDTTRLALSNPPMRADIIAANREAIGAALDRFAEQLDAVRGVVREGRHEELIAALEKAQAIRQRWGDGQRER